MTAAEPGYLGELAFSLGAGLVAPFVLVPGLLIGRFVRAWWQAVAAALLFGLVLLAVLALVQAPVGPAFVRHFVPAAVAGPLFWTAAGFLLRRRSQRYRVADPARYARRRSGAVIGLLAGPLAGGLLGWGVGEGYVTAAQVSNFEGGAGYAVLSAIVIGAFAGALLGPFVGWRLAPRRRPAPLSGSS